MASRSRDDDLLDALFAGNLQPPPRPVAVPEPPAEIISDDEQRARSMESEGVRAAESGNLAGALDIFNTVVAEFPARASGSVKQRSSFPIIMI